MNQTERIHETAVLHPTAIVEPGATIGPYARVWHFSHVRSTAELKKGVSIGRDVYVDADITIGEFSRVQNGVSIYKGVEIADWCFVGPHVIFTNDQRPRAGNRRWDIVPTRLQTGCSLGAGSIVRCGLTIGSFAMIGAGAVVTKSVPAFTLAVGFPAREKGRVCACGHVLIGEDMILESYVLDCCRERLHLDLIPIAEKISRQYLQES